MSGRKKFEPEKVTAALKLLRALPVKDNRKTTGEALHMLKGGILEALEKGYDRTEIRKLIAAEVPLSSTTFNDFLAANLKEDTEETGMSAGSKRKTGQEKTPTAPEQTGKGRFTKTASSAALERKPATATNGNAEHGKSEILKPTPARAAEPKKMPSYYTPDLPDSEL